MCARSCVSTRWVSSLLLLRDRLYEVESERYLRCSSRCSRRCQFLFSTFFVVVIDLVAVVVGRPRPHCRGSALHRVFPDRSRSRR